MRNKPFRMCAVCREMTEKKGMLRIVLNKEGIINIDESGKMNGRGAYICDGCTKEAAQSKALERSFKRSVPKEIYKLIEGRSNGN